MLLGRLPDVKPDFSTLLFELRPVHLWKYVAKIPSRTVLIWSWLFSDNLERQMLNDFFPTNLTIVSSELEKHQSTCWGQIKSQSLLVCTALSMLRPESNLVDFFWFYESNGDCCAGDFNTATSTSNGGAFHEIPIRRGERIMVIEWFESIYFSYSQRQVVHWHDIPSLQLGNALLDSLHLRDQGPPRCSRLCRLHGVLRVVNQRLRHVRRTPGQLLPRPPYQHRFRSDSRFCPRRNSLHQRK